MPAIRPQAAGSPNYEPAAAEKAKIARRGVVAPLTNETSGQQTLSFVDVGAGVDVYEYSVLATSLDEELVSFGQLYRDRGDSDIDQAWRLSRFCGRGGGAVGEPRRRAAPMRRRRADRLQRGDRLGVGAHQLGTFRAAANVSTG